MSTRSVWICAVLAAALPSLSGAARITLRANDVIPVTIEDTLDIDRSRPGDVFSATVADDRDFPRGTRFEGRVVDVQRRRGDRPAYLDLEFTDVVIGRERTRIQARPVSLGSAYVTRSRDGRWTATNKVIKREHAVIGGAVGGLLIGTILKKPFEGAFVGALAGIILAESQRPGDGGEVAIRRGTRIGALIERDVTITFDDRYDDRYGDRYDDRYDRGRNDDRPNRPNDVRRRDDRYDRWDRRDRYDERPLPREERPLPTREQPPLPPREERPLPPLDDRPADREGPAIIRYRGRELRFANDPFREYGTWYVPLEEAARQLDLDVHFSRDSRVIYIEDGDSQLRLEQDSRDFRLNGRRGTVEAGAVNREGVVYVPLELLAAMKPDAIYANGTRIQGPGL